MSFTIGYGVGNVQTRDESLYNNVAQVLSDTSLQSALSFDPNQVDARVNGEIIDVNAGVYANMRIELVKKAGRKSVEGPEGALVLENQLEPIGIALETRAAIEQHAKQATAPLLAALNKAEKATSGAVKAKQRELIEKDESFQKWNSALIDSLVETNYVDNVGALTVPQTVREALAKVASDADAELDGQRKELRDAEKKVDAWLRSVIADVNMSVTVQEQRVLVAKVLASNPLEAWTFEA